MARVRVKYGTKARYDALETKDPNTLYFITDRGLVYKGDILVTNKFSVVEHGTGDNHRITVTDNSTNPPSTIAIYGNEAIDAFLEDLVRKPTLSLNNGLRVYLNGVDVTNIANVQPLDAARQWFGSASQYAKLVHDNLVENDVAYYLQPNPDWDETDEESLSYIKNKPKILDVTTEDTNANNKKMILFYK